MTVSGAANGIGPLHEPIGQDPADPPSAFDHFKSLPIEEQSARLTALAEQGGIIVGLDSPDEFALLASDKALHFFMDYVDEPLSSDWMDAFEGLLQKDDYESAQFRAAVLLFRYGRDSGRTYLLQLLEEEHDLRAALIFAAAQEPETESAIVGVIPAALAQRKDLHALEDVLVRWESVALDQALSQPDVYEAFIAQSALLSYGRLRGGSADPELATAVRNATFDSSHYDLWTRLRLGAAVIRRNPDDANTRAFLLQELHERPNLWVFRAIEATGDATFIDDLMVNLDLSMSAPENETRDDRNDRLRNAEHGMEAIVRLGGELAPAHAMTLHVQRPTQRLQLMMIRSGNEILIDAVRTKLGDEEVDRIIALQQLKPVPDPHPQYVPDSSRGWVWY